MTYLHEPITQLLPPVASVIQFPLKFYSDFQRLYGNGCYGTVETVGEGKRLFCVIWQYACVEKVMNNNMNIRDR